MVWRMCSNWTSGEQDIRKIFHCITFILFKNYMSALVSMALLVEHYLRHQKRTGLIPAQSTLGSIPGQSDFVLEEAD